MEPAKQGTRDRPEPHLRDIDWLPLERRRQKFLDLYLFAVEASLRGGARRWWLQAFSCEQASDPDKGVPDLKKFCLQQLLYEAGDIGALRRVYEVLSEEGFLDDDEWGRFLLDLMRHLCTALANADQDTTQRATVWNAIKQRGWFARRPRAVVSIVILDGISLANFFEFCIPSLSQEGGLKALAAAREVSLHVFARQRDLSNVKRALEVFGPDCTIVGQAIPEELAARAEGVAGPQTEWLVGALQGLHLMEARRRHADFHSLNPNAVYSSGFFEGVARLRDEAKKAVLLAAFYAEAATMRDRLAPFRRDGALSVPPADLAGAGLSAAAPGSGLQVVRDVGYLGGSTSHLQLMWEGEDRVHIHSTQHELAFLAADVLEGLPDRFFVKPLAEVDRMLPADVLPHFVGETDRMALVDLGGRKDTFDGEQLDLAKFGAEVLESARQRQKEYFKQPVCVAVSRAACPQRPWREGPAIERESGVLLQALGAPQTLATPTGERTLTALSVLQQYELSEYGLDDMPAVIAEARRLLDVTGTSGGVLEDAIRRDLIRASLNFDHFDNAVALAREGGEGTAFLCDFLAETARLRAANEARAHYLRQSSWRRRFAVVGLIVWGPRFVDKFMNYCLPSLLASGNIPALARKGRAVVSIVTTEPDRDRMTAHPAFARLRKHAEVVFTCFSPELLERREKDGLNFYHFYGLLDHQSVFLAAALRADLYLLPIDCVYSNACLENFSRYLRKDADCCSVAAIESDEAGLRAWLDADGRRRPDLLDLSSKELVQAAAQRPDRYFRSMIMRPENTEFCAHPRELVWPFADGLAIHSVFMHPLAVSARLLSRPFHPHHENVDYALLPRLMQGDGRLKVIEDASEAVLGHFGAPPTRNEYLGGGFSIRDFIEAHRYDYAVHRRFFAGRQFFPCRTPPYAPSTDYAAELSLIQSALSRNRFRAERSAPAR
jgi:hypothetical protein